MPSIKQEVETINCKFVYRYPARYLNINEKGKHRHRAIKINPSSEGKKERNKRQGQKNHRHLIYNNIIVGDWWITLTYKKEKILKPEVAHKRIMLILGIIRKRLKKLNIPFLYDVKTEAGEKTRVHHHLFIKNNSPLIIGWLMELWAENGKVKDVQKIYDMISGRLVEYYLNPTNHKDMDFEKFSHSRNMAKPEVKTRIYPSESIRKNPKPPKDDEQGNIYKIIALYNSDPDLDGNIYQSYRIIKNPPKNLDETEIHIETDGWKGKRKNE